jgi:hypothetical protein
MQGNRLGVTERLASGSATGALTFECNGVRLQARLGPKGRGLFVACDVSAGSVLCTLPGVFFEGSAPPAGKEVFLSRKAKPGVPGRWLVLDAPTPSAPGNLANTSAGRGDSGNNAKLVYKPGSTFVSLRSTRALRNGEEVLCAYGGAYTRALRAASAVSAPGHPFDKVACAACGADMQRKDLSAHAKGFACPARRHGPSL